MEKGKRTISTDEEIKIFADPYRMKIIETFIGEKRPMTVKEVADILGEIPAKIHYHVRKLLSIDILELDHIEVIHGINAKYYTLVHDSFRFEVNKDDNLRMRSLQFQGITKIVMNQIENFKKDFLDRADMASSDTNDLDNDGFVTSTKIYLSEKEYLELEELMTHYIRNHNTHDKSKKKYSIFIGLIGKE